MAYPSRQFTVCPHCATEATLTEAVEPPSIARGGDRLVWDEWELLLEEDYFYDRYRVEYPPELKPRKETLVQSMTQRAYIWLSSIPIAHMALLLALFMPHVRQHHLAVIFVVLVLAFCMLPLAYMRSRKGDEAERERDLIEIFWLEVAPQFHPRYFVPKQMELVRDVCYFELNGELPLKRRGELLRQNKLCQTAIEDGFDTNTPGRLGRLMVPGELRLLNHAQLSGVPLALRLVEDLQPCASAKLPLVFADEVLQQFSRVNEERDVRVPLRILLCRAWFEAGWQPRTLNLMGKLYPHLGRAIASENESGLWNLYTLWKRAKVQDWKTLGEVETVFELASDATERSAILMKEPDLLMVIQRPEDSASGRHSIILCEEGLFYDKRKITDPTMNFELKSTREHAKKLRAWSEYYFETFQHYIAYYQQQEKAAYHDTLWKERLCKCPKCGTVYLGVPGEGGIAVGDIA